MDPAGLVAVSVFIAALASPPQPPCQSKGAVLFFYKVRSCLLAPLYCGLAPIKNYVLRGCNNLSSKASKTQADSGWPWGKALIFALRIDLHPGDLRRPLNHARFPAY